LCRDRPCGSLYRGQSYRGASIWITLHLQANKDKITGLSSWLTVSCVLLTVEIITWSVSLAG
jgi:hypothetical protein